MACYFVSGALGCIGAWTVRLLMEKGDEVVAFDLRGASDHRLRLMLSDHQIQDIVRIDGDVTDLTQIERALDEHGVTDVIHLAALQVPACSANPPLGAAVNVVGTTNVFEAVKRRLDTIDRVVYASSAAVYGANSSPREDSAPKPDTHYGVFKCANENTASIYWKTEGVTSVGLRPYVVYGPGRDQGLTSAPTAALLAASRGQRFHIPWGGRVQFHYAPDVAQALVMATRSSYQGALVANFPGRSDSMNAFVASICSAVGNERGALVTHEDDPLPFPAELEATACEAALGPIHQTRLADGVKATIEMFQRRLPDAPGGPT